MKLIWGVNYILGLVVHWIYRQVFCWIDKWFGMTMEDIRALEDKVREELDRVIYFLMFYICVD